MLKFQKLIEIVPLNLQSQFILLLLFFSHQLKSIKAILSTHYLLNLLLHWVIDILSFIYNFIQFNEEIINNKKIVASLTIKYISIEIILF